MPLFQNPVTLRSIMLKLRLEVALCKTLSTGALLSYNLKQKPDLVIFQYSFIRNWLLFQLLLRTLEVFEAKLLISRKNLRTLIDWRSDGFKSWQSLMERPFSIENKGKWHKIRLIFSSTQKTWWVFSIVSCRFIPVLCFELFSSTFHLSPIYFLLIKKRTCSQNLTNRQERLNYSVIVGILDICYP